MSNKQEYKDKKESIYKYMSRLSKATVYMQPDEKEKFLGDARSEGKSFNRYALDAMEEHYLSKRKGSTDSNNNEDVN